MAVAALVRDPVSEEPDAGTPGPAASRRHGRNHQWVFTLLPTFPVVLLILRLYYLSRQDVSTLLLLVEYVNPLSLITTMLITLVWAVPVAILVMRLLAALHAASAMEPDTAAGRASWLRRADERVPDWVVGFAVVLALITWQLRFLPALLMITIGVLALSARIRRGDRDPVARMLAWGLPATAALAAYLWLAPGIAGAVDSADAVTVVLLAGPPVATLALTGPLPARYARPVTHSVALALAMLAPLALGVVFLRAPILPTVALEVSSPGGPDQVVRGDLINVDDEMTVLLDGGGHIRFVPNARVTSRTLCPDPQDVPRTAVNVRGWPVEQSALWWMAPRPTPLPPDSRCAGRV